MAKAPSRKLLVTLVDPDGTKQTFEALEVFAVDGQPFSVLKAVGSDASELLVLKCAVDAKGTPTRFAEPTEAEFKAAVAVLEGGGCGCACDDEACACTDACCEPEPKPAKPKKAARTAKSAKKASPAKKAPKRAAPKKKPAARAVRRR